MYFYEDQYDYSVYPEMYVTNRYGVVIASTGRTSDYLQADEEWYQDAMAEEEFWVGEVEYDESSDSYALDIVILLHDGKGEYSGILKAVLNIEEPIKIIKELERERALEERQSIHFQLATKDGKLIYATKKFRFLEDISDKLRWHGETPGYYHIRAGDEPGEGEELSAYSRSKGYNTYKGLGWILIVDYETKQIFAPSAKLKVTTFIISQFITVIAVLLGFFFARAITRPILALRDAVAKIGEGKLDTQINVETRDEVGQLADSFRKMATDLKETTTSISNLEKEICERERAEEENIRLAAFPKDNPNPITTFDAEGNCLYINPAAEKLVKQFGLETITALLPVNHKTILDRLFAEPVADIEDIVTVKGRIFAWLYLYSPAIRAAYLYGRDVTAQKHADALTEQMTELKDSLINATVYLSEGLDVEITLENTLTTAKKLTEAEYAALVVIEDNRLARIIQLGMTEDQVKAIPVCPPQEGLIKAVISERRTIRIPDVSKHPASSGFPEGHPMMTSFLGTPRYPWRHTSGEHLSDGQAYGRGIYGTGSNHY